MIEGVRTIIRSASPSLFPFAEHRLAHLRIGIIQLVEGLSGRQHLGSLFVLIWDLYGAYNRFIMLAPPMIAVYGQGKRKPLQFRTHLLTGQTAALTEDKLQWSNLRTGHPLAPYLIRGLAQHIVELGADSLEGCPQTCYLGG
ncbi:hypothetical protein D3C75_922250 [compost metagenome]